MPVGRPQSREIYGWYGWPNLHCSLWPIQTINLPQLGTRVFHVKCAALVSLVVIVNYYDRHFFLCLSD